MPRAKRSLEVAESNAPKPAPKRGKRADKENETPTADAPPAAVKQAPVTRSRKAAAPPPPQLPKKAAPKRTATKKAAPAPELEPAAPSPTSYPPCTLTWVTTPRLICDLRREVEATATTEDEDEDGPRELTAAERKKRVAECAKYNKKPLEKYPTWPWRISEFAYMASAEYSTDVEKRDPDSFGMYIYNDFWSYGCVEVLDNILSAFAKEYLKKDACVWELWKHTETTAHFFVMCDGLDGALMMCDDGERVESILELVSSSLLSTLNKLEEAQLLKPDGPVKDLELVLSLYFHWWPTYSENLDVEDLLEKVNAYANKAGLKLDKLYNIKETIDEYPESNMNKKERDLVRAGPKEDKFKFKKSWNAYVKRHGSRGIVGGTDYDITKMTKKERIKFSFDGQDPMDRVIEG